MLLVAKLTLIWKITLTSQVSRLKLDLIQQVMDSILNKLTKRDLTISKMSALEAMIEMLNQQNEEKERQTDASSTNSSFAVRASNMVTGVNKTHKHQRNHFHDEEDEEDYENTPMEKRWKSFIVCSSSFLGFNSKLTQPTINETKRWKCSTVHSSSKKSTTPTHELSVTMSKGWKPSIAYTSPHKLHETT